MSQKSARRILYLTNLFFWFSQSSYLPYVSPSLNAMGAAATLIGLVGGAYGFTQTICRIPLGIIVDRYNLQKKTIIVGTILSCLSGLGIFITFSPAGFLIFRATAGLASATWICFTAAYSGLYPKEESASAMSTFISGNHAGKLLGLLIVGVFATATRDIFLMASVGCIVAVVLSLFVKQPDEQTQNSSVKDLLPVIKNKTLLICSCFALLFQVITCSTTYQFTPIVLKNLGADDFTLAAVNMITLVFLILSTVFSGKFLVQKFGGKKLFLLGFIFLSVYAVGTGFATSIWQMFILQALAGLGEGFGISILAGMCIRDIPVEKRSTAMGIFSAIYGVGMTIGPVITGVVTDALGLTAAFVAIGGLAAAAFLSALRVVE